MPKDTKKKEPVKTKGETTIITEESLGAVTTKSELKNFLQGVHDKMAEGVAAPIYALGAMNHVLNLPTIYDLLDSDNKELARNIWLRLKQSGLQVRNPQCCSGKMVWEQTVKPASMNKPVSVKTP